MSYATEIRKNIKWIASTAAKVNQNIHETALLILKQAHEFSDCSLAKDLFNAMPRSMRRTTLKLWFETFSPIRFQLREGDAVKVGMLKEVAKGYVPFDIEGATEKPFYVIADETPEGKILDFAALVKLVQSLAGQIEKKIENGKVADEDVDSAKAISAKLASLSFTRVLPANDEGAGEEAPRLAAVA